MKIFAIFLILLALLPAGRLDADGTAVNEAVRVSVFDFETAADLPEGLGSEIADMVNAYLSAHPNLKMVERTEMQKILAELGLSGTGNVDQEQAVRIGRIVGAEILVTGRVFPIDGEMVIVARIIGTETTRVFGKVVKGIPGGKPIRLIEEVADKIASTIGDNRSELLPPAVLAEDKLELIRQAVQGRTPPRVSIRIYEEFGGRAAADSVAETEMISILTGCGFEVIQPEEELSPGRVKTYLENSTAGIPGLKDRVEILLIGEAFSETTDHTHPLFSSKGRVEIRAIEVSSGRILAVARKTASGVDLLERTSAVNALEKATIEVAAILIPEIMNRWSR